MSATGDTAASVGTMTNQAGHFEMGAAHMSPRQHAHPLPQSPPAAHSLQVQQQQQQQQQQQHRSVKRPRPVKSCTECRKRKLRCDRLCPCSQCQKSGRHCKYAVDYDSANLSDLSDGEIEAGRPAKRSYVGSIPSQPTASVESGQGTARNGETAVSAGSGFVEELAQRMDRMERHLLSRDPGHLRLAGSRPVAIAPAALRGLTVKRGGQSTRHFGQSNPRVLLNMFEEAKDVLKTAGQTPGLEETLQRFYKLHQWLREEHQQALAPITVFVDSVMPIWKRMTDILPKRAICDRLITAYIDHSEAICRIIHFPTFFEQYNLFWEGKLQSDYFLPQLLSTISIASRFTTKSKGFGHERLEGVHLPTACALVRTWLDGLKGKQLIDFGVLQVELLLIVCKKTLMYRPQELWTELGSVVRMGMAMGLHRDPSESGGRFSPFQSEMRRRLWYSMLDMDVQISMDCDMPCLVRDGDFSSRPPRNLDDRELYLDLRDLPPGKSLDQSTDSQLLVLAASSLPTRSRICEMLLKIDSVRDYHEVMELGSRMESFLEDMEQILPRRGITDHSRASRVWRERVTFDAHIRRSLLALYRPFAVGGQGCPPQISRGFMRSCMITLHWADELDPMLPHYQDTMAVLHQIFRSSILPSAFSICHFIRALVQPQANGVTLDAQRAVRLSSGSPNSSPSIRADSLLLWSPERLIDTVERTLDRFTQNVRRNTDTKELIALCVVLEMVRSSDPRADDIVRALRSCLDRCLNAVNMDHGKLEQIKLRQTHARTASFASDSYMGGRQGSYAYDTATAPQSHVGGMSNWLLWSGWD